MLRSRFYKKTISLFLTMLSCSFLFLGCVKTYSEDYYQKYSNYLSYAFGEHSILGPESRSYSATPVPYLEYYDVWTLTYTSFGEEYTFTFSNKGKSDFEASIRGHISNRATKIIASENLESTFFPGCSEDSAVSLVSVVIDGKTVNSLTSTKFLGFIGKNGIDFQNFTLEEVFNYDLTYKININLQLIPNSELSEEKTNAMHEEILSLGKYFQEKFSRNDLSICFRIENAKEDSFFWRDEGNFTYNRESDSWELSKNYTSPYDR